MIANAHGMICFECDLVEPREVVPDKARKQQDTYRIARFDSHVHNFLEHHRMKSSQATTADRITALTHTLCNARG